MNTIINPARSQWQDICVRPSDDNPVVRERVEKIIARVKAGGDKALNELAQEIDGFVPESIEVSEEAIRTASASIDDSLKEAIAAAAANIRAFHEAQMPKAIEVMTAAGVRCIQKPVAIGKVGLYIPGGTAPLFSTVLMLAIPAKIAGCGEIILCTPAGKDGKIAPAVLYAASYCGVDRIFQVGGSQAIAAMAFGTESIPKVDKIFGPGNQYVTTAKQMLGGKAVAIDMPAGPSEVMVIVDGSSNPAYAAADLLSQAEHGIDSQVILISTSEDMISKVEEELQKQLAVLPRHEIAEKTLENSQFVLVKDKEEAMALSNAYAPEHLIIATDDYEVLAEKVINAGSVFLGNYACESAGDYASGTNHTLPTHGYALAYNGVNLDSYNRKVTFQHLSEEGIRSIGKAVVCMAENEMLEAHANAMRVRVNDVK